ncbi:MAG: hypothetical protein V4490_03720, partial [Pseudomonadota bacterium]
MQTGSLSERESGARSPRDRMSELVNLARVLTNEMDAHRFSLETLKYNVLHEGVLLEDAVTRTLRENSRYAASLQSEKYETSQLAASIERCASEFFALFDRYMSFAEARNDEETTAFLNAQITQFSKHIESYRQSAEAVDTGINDLLQIVTNGITEAEMGRFGVSITSAESPYLVGVEMRPISPAIITQASAWRELRVPSDDESSQTQSEDSSNAT